jgi:hypothetical protein
MPSMNTTQPIGQPRFTDGPTRPVYRDSDGRQFVFDDAENGLAGVWIFPGPDG